MIRITIETTLSTHYALFRLRWLTIAIQTICLILGLLLTLMYSNHMTRPLWAVTSFFTFSSIVVCMWDLVAHKKGTTPPSSPRSPSPVARPQSTAVEGGQASSSQTLDATPRPSTDADVISIHAEEERIPFLPPRPSSISEKSDRGADKPREYPFRPNRGVMAFDLVIAAAFIMLYIVNMVVESLAWQAGGYWYGRQRGYALRTHATIGTMIAVILHLHCFYKEAKALKKEKREETYRRVGKGVIRI